MSAWGTVRNHVASLMGWARLDEATPESVSAFQSLLRSSGLKETSIATNLRTLRAALNWGQSVGLCGKVRVNVPRRGRRETAMRGRPVTEAELKRMLREARNERPHDHYWWRRLMRGLYLSGLRLGEALILHWDHGSFIVDLAGKHPRFRIWSEGEKGRKDRLLPMTPDFAKWLLRTPEDQRRGRVFPVPYKYLRNVGKVISAIGKRAEVLANPSTHKYATAHDLRRSFGTRWSSRVKPAVLQLLMRHEDITTTMKFYVAQNADDLAEGLWDDYG